MQDSKGRRETQTPAVLGKQSLWRADPSPPRSAVPTGCLESPVGACPCCEPDGPLTGPDPLQAWPCPHPMPFTLSSGARGPNGQRQGSWPRGKGPLSASWPPTGAEAPALRSSRASFSASFRKGGRRAGSASQQLPMRAWMGPGQPSGGSMRYPFSTASDTSFSDCGQRAQWRGWGQGPSRQTHKEPRASPQAPLTILGYGARPYENTSHRSTPKLQTSDLLENFCGAQDQGEEGPRLPPGSPPGLTLTLWSPPNRLPLSLPEPSGTQTQCREGSLVFSGPGQSLSVSEMGKPGPRGVHTRERPNVS